MAWLVQKAAAQGGGPGPKMCRARIQCSGSSPEQDYSVSVGLRSLARASRRAQRDACDSGRATKQLPQVRRAVGKAQEGEVGSVHE